MWGKKEERRKKDHRYEEEKHTSRRLDYEVEWLVLVLNAFCPKLDYESI